MPPRNNRYMQMKKIMTYTLLADSVMFVIYLFAAGFGVMWLKVFTSIITILASTLSLGYLYITQEIFKKRSLWMTAAAGAILFCILYSLILGFPCPTPAPGNI